MTGSLPPILCIIGRKDSGKTELTVALCGELTRRGHRVMTVKHGHGFHLDHPGKDSWRHRHEGGAYRTAVVGPSDFGILGRWPQGEMELAEVVGRFLWDADLVLAEGFKKAPEPKIEVFRRAPGQRPLLVEDPERFSSTLALVTDLVEARVGVPLFRLGEPGHLKDLADFLEDRLLAEGRGG